MQFGVNKNQCLNFALVLREKCNCGICVACRSFFKCTDLHRVNVLQLAVNSADDDVNGNCDCDSSEHTHCTVEHDLHGATRKSPVWSTAYSHGKISFSGMLQSGPVN